MADKFKPGDHVRRNDDDETAPIMTIVGDPEGIDKFEVVWTDERGVAHSDYLEGYSLTKVA
jgi:hypothetical protein